VDTNNYYYALLLLPWNVFGDVLVVAGQHNITVHSESHGGGRLWVKLSVSSQSQDGLSGPTRAGPRPGSGMRGGLLT